MRFFFLVFFIKSDWPMEFCWLSIQTEHLYYSLQCNLMGTGINGSSFLCNATFAFFTNYHSISKGSTNSSKNKVFQLQHHDWWSKIGALHRIRWYFIALKRVIKAIIILYVIDDKEGKKKRRSRSDYTVFVMGKNEKNLIATNAI